MTNPATTEIERVLAEAKLDLEYAAGARAALRMLSGGMPESEILEHMQRRADAARSALRTQQEAEWSPVGFRALWDEFNAALAAAEATQSRPKGFGYTKAGTHEEQATAYRRLHAARDAIEAAFPIQQAPQAEAVHQWRYHDKPETGWHDGPPVGQEEWATSQRLSIETRTLYREPVVTAKAQEDALITAADDVYDRTAHMIHPDRNGNHEVCDGAMKAIHKLMMLAGAHSIAAALESSREKSE